MIRAYALLFAAVTMLGGAGQAQAESFDARDIFGGGPNFSIGRSSPIRRQTVYFASNYAPGTILIDSLSNFTGPLFWYIEGPHL